MTDRVCGDKDHGTLVDIDCNLQELSRAIELGESFSVTGVCTNCGSIIVRGYDRSADTVENGD